MSGPPPKDPSVRQRRNRSSGAATLSLAPNDVVVPDLPERYDAEGLEAEWHPRTLAWWNDVWTSPMAPEYLDADVHGLYLLAELEESFHRADGPRAKVDLAKEIRLQRMAYGLTPIDRRRLQWEVDRGDEADGRRRRRTQSQRDADGRRDRPAGDPRALLAAVPSGGAS